MIYSPKKLKLDLQNWLISEFDLLKYKPELHIINVGDLLASKTYIEMKQKKGVKLGVDVSIHNFSVQEQNDKVQLLLEYLTEKKLGTIIQLPVPEKMHQLVSDIADFIDVDMLGKSAGRLWELGFLPPTIQAIDLVLKEIINDFTDLESSLNHKLDFSGKIVAVIGQGDLVGKPLLRYLSERNATIISINKDTPNSAYLSSKADILISAAGSPGLITDDWLKSDSVLIDASTSESNGQLLGDVDDYKLSVDHILCPSPGGIGGVTVLCLFYNLLKLNLDNSNYV